MQVLVLFEDEYFNLENTEYFADDKKIEVGAFCTNHLSGVINPNHCIEEYIDDRVNVILYERFFNWEIAAGNYLVKNSEFGMKFLQEWANFEFRLPNSWHGYDQGPLQVTLRDVTLRYLGCYLLLLLKLLIPESTLEYEACERYWKNATSYETYMAMVYCVRQALGVTKTWPGKVHILRKFHGFVRDGWATNGYWCKADFMLHGWKEAKLNETPFEKDIDLKLCDKGLKAWKWQKEKKVSVERLRYVV
ncbi:unnamed protein product [Cylicostephanus goldi]|uniref:Uncharacterized protein n=1 Tax=Cylicostephanus goldi TaxID=71465 RepID=A0A3P6RA22_CYLGO|nr:unnamed protein product [Cylicostephanus goldi]